MTEPKHHYPLPECMERFEHIDNRLKSIAETTNRIDKSLRGNGETGMNVRVDRLECQSQRSAKAMWALFGSILAIIVTVVAAIIKVHFGT